MATESQRQQRHAAAASHLSADSGSSVFLLRVRISYPSSSTLPHHCDSTSPGLLGVDRSSTVSAGSDPRMSGVCGLSVLETHRISRATRTANVMSLFVFCESRGGRRTTLSPIILRVKSSQVKSIILHLFRHPFSARPEFSPQWGGMLKSRYTTAHASLHACEASGELHPFPILFALSYRDYFVLRSAPRVCECDLSLVVDLA